MPSMKTTTKTIRQSWCNHYTPINNKYTKNVQTVTHFVLSANEMQLSCEQGKQLCETQDICAKSYAINTQKSPWEGTGEKNNEK